jgi:hypothetical protein
MMKWMIATIILCMVSAGSWAQSAPAPTFGNAQNAQMDHAMRNLGIRFATSNTTRDGKLTREQAAAGMPTVASHFDAIDTQRVGYVTLSQVEAYMRQQSTTH